MSEDDINQTIQEFKNITGVDNKKIINKYLSQAENNLEHALNYFFMEFDKIDSCKNGDSKEMNNLKKEVIKIIPKDNTISNNPFEEKSIGKVII